MKKGFTLIEVVIYTALVAVVFSTIVLTTHAINQTRGKARLALILEENLRFAITRITHHIHEADTVVSPDYGESASTLSIEFPMSENPFIISLTDGQIMAGMEGGETFAWTSNEVEITNLSFTRLSGTPPSLQILIEAQIQDASGVFQTSLSTQNTAVIRH